MPPIEQNGAMINADALARALVAAGSTRTVTVDGAMDSAGSVTRAIVALGGKFGIEHQGAALNADAVQRILAGGFGSAAAAPYAFLKTQFATRMYARGGTGAAANSSSWVSGNALTSGYVTSHACFDAEAPFTQIALIFGNVDAVTYPIAGASVAVGATLNDLTNSTDASRQNFVAVTFGGLSTATVPAATNGGINAGMLISDFANLVSVTRQAGDATTWSVAGGKLADSYTRPLLHIRVAQPITAANTPLLGFNHNGGSTDSPFNPAQPTRTGRFISVKNAADATVQTSVGAAAALTGTTYGPFSGIVNIPVIGFILKYGVNAMTFMTNGNSITFGAGILHVGSADSTSNASGSERSWSRVATETVSTMTQPIEFCKLAVSGTPTTTFVQYLTNAISAGITPTHATYASFSPNDGDAGTSVQITNLATFMTACASKNIYPITWTGLPVGLLAPQKLTAAAEGHRLAWNTSMRAGTLPGAPLIDYMEMDQCTDGSGQIMSDNVSPIASMTNTPVHWGDASTTVNLHPNYTGDVIMRTVYAAKMLQISAKYYA